MPTIDVENVWLRLLWLGGQAGGVDIVCTPRRVQRSQKQTDNLLAVHVLTRLSSGTGLRPGTSDENREGHDRSRRLGAASTPLKPLSSPTPAAQARPLIRWKNRLAQLQGTRRTDHPRPHQTTRAVRLHCERTAVSVGHRGSQTKAAREKVLSFSGSCALAACSRGWVRGYDALIVRHRRCTPSASRWTRR